jgi:hypothetical protein
LRPSSDMILENSAFVFLSIHLILRRFREVIVLDVNLLHLKRL